MSGGEAGAEAARAAGTVTGPGGAAAAAETGGYGSTGLGAVMRLQPFSLTLRWLRARS